jgi:hypothetical protein
MGKMRIEMKSKQAAVQIAEQDRLTSLYPATRSRTSWLTNQSLQL